MASGPAAGSALLEGTPMPPGEPPSPPGQEAGRGRACSSRSQAGWDISSHTSWNASQAKPLQGRPHKHHLLSQHRRRSGLETPEVFAERATKHIIFTPDLNSQTCSVATGALHFSTTESVESCRRLPLTSQDDPPVDAQGFHGQEPLELVHPGPLVLSSAQPAQGPVSRGFGEGAAAQLLGSCDLLAQDPQLPLMTSRCPTHTWPGSLFLLKLIPGDWVATTSVSSKAGPHLLVLGPRAREQGAATRILHASHQEGGEPAAAPPAVLPGPEAPRALLQSGTPGARLCLACV